MTRSKQPVMGGLEPDGSRQASRQQFGSSSLEPETRLWGCCRAAVRSGASARARARGTAPCKLRIWAPARA